MPHPYPPDLNDEELEIQARKLANAIGWGPLQYLEELNRRVIDRQTKKLIRLTWAIVALTIVLAVLTAALVYRELA